jgi:signal transduction histidine kinase
MSPAPESTPDDTSLMTAFLAGVPCALCVVDEADRLRLCNEPFARLFETTPEDARSRPVTDFVSAALWRQLGGRSDHPGIAGECFRGAHNVFSAAVVVRSLPNRDHAWRLVTISPDESREHLLESLATLAGGVAHEFNNVLTVVLGYGALLPDLGAEPESLRKTADQIMAAARRGADVVYQLQIFARTAECARAPHHLHQLVHDAVAHISRLWPASITVDLALTPEPDLLMVNAPQLILALQHLLQNAREALPLDTGSITLRTTRHPDLVRSMLCLSVEDNGVGMDDNTRRRAMDPFFSRHRAGFPGLGLAVAHGVTKAHGGKLEITASPRGGARIRLWFPCPVADPLAANPPLVHVADEHQQSLIDAVLQRH